MASLAAADISVDGTNGGTRNEERSRAMARAVRCHARCQGKNAGYDFGAILVKGAGWLRTIVLVPAAVAVCFASACADDVADPSVTLAGTAFRGEPPGPAGPAAADWPVYAHDNAGTKHSPVDQINRGNVQQLKIAWRWASVDNDVRDQGGAHARTLFEATPLMIRNTLFFPTAFTRAVALDAATGKPAWIHDPGSHRFETRTPLGIHSRGVSYWRSGSDERIVFGTSDGYLLALDAKTGVPIAGFGNGGRVDLTLGLGRAVDRRFYSVTSPPVISGDVIVIGSWIPDVPIHADAPRGDVRGFDVRTGKLLWTFHTIPQAGQFGTETWENDSWRRMGHTNVWAPMTADAELGYVYLPVSMPTHNFYGGDRLGDNLFADSIVCLDARTGRRVWHYQIIHHDIWDYDLAAAPNLMDIVVNGRSIKAVAIVTKHGFLFVFDRVTGAPVWPIEERRVPASRLSGERNAPTQPFPTNPPPFERQTLFPDDVTDFTPEIRAEALKLLERYDHGPLYLPPSTRGAIILPGWVGGASWSGAAYDPDTSVLYVPSITIPVMVQLGEPGIKTTLGRWFGRPERRVDSAYETKFVGELELSGELPLTKPPYGRITAYDMTRGSILWQIANGWGPAKHPKLAALNLPRLGSTGRTSVLVTGSLLFAGEGPSGKARGGDPYFRAYDKATGQLLWEVKLDSHVQGAPMTYVVDNKQYVVVACGGFTERHELVAFAIQ
jgi:quinoprotein glucose dehydrogenase